MSACADDKDKPDKASSTQRVYGRGMLDGLRLAGVTDPEELMNEARLQRAEQGLNGLARKVLECVPHDTACSVETIVAILHKHGINASHNYVLGSLSGLFEKGLVKEPTPKHFVRVQARKTLTLATDKGEHVATKQTPPPAAAPAAPPAPTPAPHPPAKVDTLDAMAQLAQNIRAQAAAMQALALEVESVALSVQQQMQDAAKEGELLRQFQAFIKSIKGE